MTSDARLLESAVRVSPRALLGYAEGIGWRRVANRRPSEVAVLHRPDSTLHQIIIPTDPGLADYAEAARDAVERLAAFEKRPANEVLEHLLLPPADMLRFREVSQDAESGSLPFEHAARMIGGARRLLLSAAHSVLVPQPYHPRLSRSEAEEFLAKCRLGQTERGSFVLNVACPLNQAITLPGMEDEPFARKVTRLMIESVATLARTAESGRADELMDAHLSPGISANLCESLLMLRPSGERSLLFISIAWSRVLLPEPTDRRREVQLTQEVFEIAEALAPRLRTNPAPRQTRFIGYVDALRGQPGQDDPRPRGEVDFTLFDEQEGEVHARGILDADQYAVAGAAHLASDAVSFRATLRWLPRTSRIEWISDFMRLNMHSSEELSTTSAT